MRARKRNRDAACQEFKPSDRVLATVRNSMIDDVDLVDRERPILVWNRAVEAILVPCR